MTVSECECQYECEGICASVSVTINVSFSVMKLHLWAFPWESALGLFKELHLGMLT